MHLLPVALVLATLVAPAMAHAAWDALIRVWFDVAFSVCSTQQPPPGTGGVAYVTAQVSWEHRALGLVAAEFRLDGVPPGWIASAAPNPAAEAATGDPLGAGCSISFPAPMGIGMDKVLLFTVQYVPGSSVGPTHISVYPSLSPVIGTGQCPTVLLGDLPVRTRVCCPTGPVAAWNDPAFCSTAVQAAAWSAVRRLYE
jgi:hypothetical protein